MYQAGLRHEWVFIAEGQLLSFPEIQSNLLGDAMGPLSIKAFAWVKSILDRKSVV